MTDKVVDASAIAALLFGEPRGQAVSAQIRGCNLFAPDLLIYEVASACLKKMRVLPAERSSLGAAFLMLHQLPITMMRIDLGDTLALAAGGKLSLYDASYLWLARHMNAELITLDRELQKAATRL